MNHSARSFAPDHVIALIGRFLIAAIFLFSGWGKLTAPAATIGMIGSAGLPFPQVGLGVAVVVEIGGALALILGWRLREAAAALALFTLAAGLAFHLDPGDRGQTIHLLKNLAIAGGLLQIVSHAARCKADRAD